MASTYITRDMEHQRNNNDHDTSNVELQSRHTSRDPLMDTAYVGGDYADRQSDNGPSKIQPRRFDRRNQLRSLLWPQSLRWLGTIVLAALLMLTMKIFQDKGNFSHQDKLTYNVIFTGLSVGLGINFFEAFKGAAKILRWRVLAESSHSIRMLDLILSIESLEKVYQLGLESLSVNFWMSLACLVWIALNLAAQIAVALAGLTYDLTDGKDWSGTYVQPDIVNATNTTCYFNRHNPYGCPGTASAHDTAHIYGEQSVSSTCDPYTTIADILNSAQNPGYYCRRTESQEFAYRFKEYNPTDATLAFPHLTNRTVTASSGPCITYNLTDQKNAPDMIQDGDGYLFTFNNESYTGNISIPTANLGLSGTTYIYRDVNPPSDVDSYSCGDRCIWMWAFKNPGPINGDANGTFYQCPITVSTVNNASLSGHEIGDDVALTAAASIALQGRWSPGPNNTKIYTQFQYYPFDTPWDIHLHATPIVGANMAEFAIGSLSQLATYNPPVPLPGLRPYLGSQLSIQWPRALALFVGVIVVHFVLFISAIWAVRDVVVTEDSFLSVARLLRDVLESVGEEGTYLSSRGMSEAVQQRVGTKGVVYGLRRAEGGVGRYRLDVGQDVIVRREWGGGKHPDGTYM